MKLTIQQIKQTVHGAVEVSRDETGLIRLYRLTAYQRQLFKDMEGMFYDRACNCSGVKLMLRTDSPRITLDMQITSCATRKFFSVDIYADNKPVGYIDHLTREEPFGDYRETVDLGPGSKTVSIYLPWSATCAIRAIELADGSTFAPVKREKTLLAFGDSITQGFDSFRASMSYIAQIGDWLEAQVYNKGVGSSRFFPAMLDEPEDIHPDYVTVAYGTNDWAHSTREQFKTNAALFLNRVRKQYPDAKLFVFAPIWRKGYEQPSQFGQFREVARELETICSIVDGAIFIDCFDFVPHEESFFQDKSLHPNDAGFAHYFENLRKAMQPYV